MNWPVVTQNIVKDYLENLLKYKGQTQNPGYKFSSGIFLNVSIFSLNPTSLKSSDSKDFGLFRPSIQPLAEIYRF